MSGSIRRPIRGRRCRVRAVQHSARQAGAYLLLAVLPFSPAFADHGFALFSPLKHPDGFAHFDYVNPAAPKGGTLREGSMLTFSSLNVMRFPGNPPNELFHTFDSLMIRAQDEPASFYGLIAEDVELEEDFASVRFRLRPEARWHDGTQITSADIAFTFQTLREHGLPSQRSVLRSVEIRVVDTGTIEFRPATAGDWRYLGLIATFPIQSSRFWAKHDPGETTLEIPLGSGPYRIVSLDLNHRVTLARERDYWGRDLAVNRGRWNFDRLEILYFRDRTAMIEALKAGRLDINREFDAGLWARGYDGASLDSGTLVRTTFSERSAGSLTALVFNTRRPQLDDVRVRAALACAFDADWVRRTLFADIFEAPGSLYGNTEMAARGRAGDGERAILAPYLNHLPVELLASPAPPDCAGLSRRNRLRRADALLREAGWNVVDGERVKGGLGAPLQLEFVGGYSGIERALPSYANALEDLGISLNARFHDYVTARNEILGHNFDITQTAFSPGFPPGGAENTSWHSANAQVDGYALAGAEDPALDAAIEAIAAAEDFPSILSATRSFDRILRWRHYLIPIWRRDQVWIAHHADLRFPKRFALRRFGHLASLWWEDGKSGPSR